MIGIALGLAFLSLSWVDSKVSLGIAILTVRSVIGIAFGLAFFFELVGQQS